VFLLLIAFFYHKRFCLAQGLVDYHLQKYASALEYFTKAIFLKPDCDGSIRVVVAACFFRLGQFEKSQAALERSLTTVCCRN
jgi:tetratricopeptide (TPR) repeat protein